MMQFWSHISQMLMQAAWISIWPIKFTGIWARNLHYFLEEPPFKVPGWWHGDLIGNISWSPTLQATVRLFSSSAFDFLSSMRFRPCFYRGNVIVCLGADWSQTSEWWVTPPQRMPFPKFRDVNCSGLCDDHDRSEAARSYACIYFRSAQYCMKMEMYRHCNFAEHRLARHPSLHL
jgi:hypothetical protein